MQDPDLTAAAPRRCDQSSVTAVGGNQVLQRAQPGLSSRSCGTFAIMQRILAALAIAVLFHVPCAEATSPGLQIVVDISRQQMWLVQSGTHAYLGPVSTARRGYRTPTGKFRPLRLERVWYSTRYDRSPMPYSIFFHGGYAIHGTLESRKLGRPVSHGCIRLSVADARLLFKLVQSTGVANTVILVRH